MTSQRKTPMEKNTTHKNRGEATRAALIDSAIRIFARDGYAAAGTRDIAKQAGVNQALIAYHFGGKQGLYLAIFETIAENFRTRILPFREDVDQALIRAEKMSSEKKKEILKEITINLCDAMLDLVLQPEKKLWAQLIVREQQDPGEAFEYLFKGLFNPLLGMLTDLIRAADPKAEKDQVEVTAAGIVGQIVIWRVGRTTLARRLGQRDTEEPQIDRVRSTVHRNILAQVFQSGETP